MQRKSIFTILGVMLAVVVTSLALVFTVGPKVSAEQSRQPFLEIADEDDFIIDENGVLSGFTEKAYNKLSQCYGKGSSGEFCYDGDDYSEVHVKIPESVTCVGDGSEGIFWAEGEEGNYSFAHFVTEVSLPSNLLVINDYAFSPRIFNTRITSIVIPDKVTTIGERAFSYCCNTLRSIIIGSSVTTIGDYAFENCAWMDAMEPVVIPGSVETMGRGVFNFCFVKRFYCEASGKPVGWNNEWYYYDQWYDREAGIWRDTDITWGGVKTLTFETNGGSTIADQKVCVDHYAIAPENPTRENYVFQYWYTTDENTPFDFANEQVTDNMTLTAKWEEIPAQNNGDDNENQNNNETTNNEIASAEKKFNPLMAWIGGGIVAGLSVICGVAIVVAKKRRK